jgi:hypothetical protein
MMLREGLKLTRTGAGAYLDAEGEAWRLVPVDRAYPGKKGPTWYLQKTAGKRSEYQSGIFTTSSPDKLSADYRDALGVKNYLDIEVEGGGAVLRFKKRPAKGSEGPAIGARAEVWKPST